MSKKNLSTMAAKTCDKLNLRGAAQWLCAPLLMIIGSTAAFLGVRAGYRPRVVLTAVTCGFFVLVFLIERIFPHRTEWNQSDGQEVNDIGHMLFGTMFGSALGYFVTDLICFNIASLYFMWAAHGKFWLSDWPVGFQIGLVFLLADFGRYIHHRLMHRVPFLWRFHLLHHSGGKLTVFKTSRAHIFERFFQQFFMYGPLISLGVQPEIIFSYVVPSTLIGYLDHSNIALRFGLLEYVFMGPAAHRLHHSASRTQSNTNFGNVLILWDIIFGTFTNPLSTPSPKHVGVKNDVTSPHFFMQIAAPMRRRASSLLMASRKQVEKAKKNMASPERRRQASPHF